MKSYEGSATILGIIEGVAWLALAAGVIMGFMAFGDRNPMIGVTFYLTLAFSALAMVALCRVGQAILDIASNTGKVAFQGLPVTGAAPRASNPQGASHPDAPLTEPATTGGWPLGQIEVYRGHVITGLENRVFTNDRYFDSVDQAKIHLNSVPAKRS